MPRRNGKKERARIIRNDVPVPTELSRHIFVPGVLEMDGNARTNASMGRPVIVRDDAELDQNNAVSPSLKSEPVREMCVQAIQNVFAISSLVCILQETQLRGQSFAEPQRLRGFADI